MNLTTLTGTHNFSTNLGEPPDLQENPANKQKKVYGKMLRFHDAALKISPAVFRKSAAAVCWSLNHSGLRHWHCSQRARAVTVPPPPLLALKAGEEEQELLQSTATIHMSAKLVEAAEKQDGQQAADPVSKWEDRWDSLAKSHSFPFV